MSSFLPGRIDVYRPTSTGSTGATGPTGGSFVGPQGNTGPTGVPSTTGATGNTGGRGFTGPTGSTGAIGSTGTRGPTGTQGITGPVGTLNNTGTTGLQGPTGTRGPSGVQGITGTTASTGATGFTGSTGTTGMTGPTGIRGISTISGVTGMTGVNGASSSQGATGNTGPTGAEGRTGPASTLAGNTGSTGYRGATGLTGPTGPTGAGPGPSGDPGATGLTGPVSHTGPTGVMYDTVQSGTGSVTSIADPTGTIKTYSLATTVPTSEALVVSGIRQSNPSVSKLLGWYTTNVGGAYRFNVDASFLRGGPTTFTANYLSGIGTTMPTLPTFDTLTLTSSGSNSFVCKYNDAGRINWAARLDGDNESVSVYVDSSGNVYAAGRYRTGTLSVYHADNTLFRTLGVVGEYDVFVVKYNINGAALWAARMTGSSDDRGRSMHVDPSGSVYVTGDYFSTSLVIRNGDDTTFGVLPNTDAFGDFSETYIVKYSTNGVVTWVTRLTGGSNETGQGIVTDLSGNVYVTGRFVSDPLTIYNVGGGIFGTMSRPTGFHIYVVKYNTNGTALWRTKIFGDTAYVSADSSGNVYVIGQYLNSTCTVYNADDTTFGTLSNSGVYDTFIVKYNTNGTAQWATRIGGIDFDVGNSVSVDPSGNVYVVGRYPSNPLTFFNANGTTFATLTGSEIAFDGFVVKYNTNGTGVWRARLRASTEVNVSGVSVDSSGTVYVTGYYTGSTLTIFNTNNTTFGTLTGTSTTYKAFVIKYSTTGTVLWATQMTGTGTGLNWGRNVSVNGNILGITGTYTSNPLTLRSVGF